MKKDHKEEIIIMYDSPEAASKVSIRDDAGEIKGYGWLSRNRRFYATESQARLDGATHHKCETCGEVQKMGSYCRTCADQKSRDRYIAKEHRAWDGKTMLTMHDGDVFFRDAGDIAEYCDNNDCESSSLRLVICEPNYMCEVNTDYWSDIMPDDGDGELPKEVEEALTNLNAIIKKQGPISWSAGKYRTSVDIEEAASNS